MMRMVLSVSGWRGGGPVWALAGAAAVLVLGCASTARVNGEEATPSYERGMSATAAPGWAIHEAMRAAGPDAVEALSHVAVLANAYFEGRAPDTRGNQRAAEYVEFHFERLGLAPAFDGMGERGGALASSGGTSFQQGFSVRGGLELIEATLATVGAGGEEEAFALRTEFHPLGFSGNGRVTGAPVFVGYSIERGPGGYTSYGAEDDLTGRVAVMLRFEPIDALGESRWGRNGDWSRHASLPDKIASAQERGAVGVILINTPGASDPRSEYLETHQSTAASAGVEIPVVQMSAAGADRLIASLCDDCGTVVELRRRADEGGIGAVAMGSGSRRVSMVVDLEREQVPTTNVGAILPGRGALAGEFVVIGGHYDHLGYGHFGARDPENAGQIHPGADDNASGIAALILAARHLKGAYAGLAPGQDARSVLFLAFSAEEMGLLGAEHFAKVSALDSLGIVAMLNMDMIGRVESRRLTANGVGTSPMWDELLDRAGPRHGLEIIKSKGGIGPSDHTIFYNADIPVLHFFSGTHDDYHTVRDTFETLNYVGIAQTAGLVGDVALGLATRGGAVEFVSTGDAGSPRGASRGSAKVRLGIRPASYGETDQPGVAVGGVYEGTSAGRAGMLEGDRIVRWGGDEIPDIGAMMAKLATHEPGDEVEIVVVRGGEEVALVVVMQGAVGGE